MPIQPWKGDHYEEERLLLLGESAYSALDEEGNISPLSDTHVIEFIDDMIENFPTRPGYFRTLTRGLTGKFSPSPEERAAGWDRVMFLNLVPEPVGPKARIRPDKEQWKLAQDAFWPMLEAYRPRTVIALGKELFGKGCPPEADFWVTDSVQGFRLKDGSTTMFWAVDHPSWGLSWDRLHQVIAFATRREIVYLDQSAHAR